MDRFDLMTLSSKFQCDQCEETSDDFYCLVLHICQEHQAHHTFPEPNWLETFHFARFLAKMDGLSGDEMYRPKISKPLVKVVTFASSSPVRPTRGDVTINSLLNRQSFK